FHVAGVQTCALPILGDGVSEKIARSLVLVKPDGFRRGLSGEVLRRIEAKGYTLVALAITTPTAEQLATHYAEDEGKPFYEPLVENGRAACRARGQRL